MAVVIGMYGKCDNITKVDDDRDELIMLSKSLKDDVTQLSFFIAATPATAEVVPVQQKANPALPSGLSSTFFNTNRAMKANNETTLRQITPSLATAPPPSQALVLPPTPPAATAAATTTSTSQRVSVKVIV
jgi:hypothetical protein